MTEMPSSVATGSFIDGDDTCANCGICCRDVKGLLVTPVELERVPKLRRWVTGFDGVFHTVDLPEGCPYQAENGCCGTFETRPFDCSLYPVSLREICRTPGCSTIQVTWAWGGRQCPQRDVFVSQGVTVDQQVRLREWLTAALHADAVLLQETDFKYHLRRSGGSLIRAMVTLEAVHRLFGAIRRLASRRAADA